MGIKIKTELDLTDFMSDYFYYDELEEKLVIKEDSEIITEVANHIATFIERNVKWDFSYYELVRELVQKNKDEIIDRIVKNATDRIVKTKMINDFKKTLEE